MELFAGMDVGGTRSRAAVVDATGRLLGAATSVGGNPVTHPPQQAFDAMAEALGNALHGLPASAVGGVVLGMAGGGSLPGDAMRRGLDSLRDRLGLGCTPTVVGDVVVAFVAGTPSPDGTVLIAGTGAVAARIEGWVHTGGVDGHGWLLGDTGSAFWLGRAAVRAALAALDGRQAATALLPAVAQVLLGRDSTGPADAPRLVEAVRAAPPIALAELAPLVSAAAEAEDAVALRIVADAADALVADVVAIRPPEATSPVVLAGSVAAGPTPVAALVRAALDARWPGHVRTAGDAARAAAWLAARERGASHILTMGSAPVPVL